MNRMDSAQEILHEYLNRYLQADAEWLQVEESSATYWQARLPQTTAVTCLPDGRAKIRVRTRIVEDVTKADEALRLCLALNWYAVGWSFAYDSQGQTIDALAAICAIPQWDTYLLRLAEKAKLSSWMADVIAERLADAVGGAPAFSHPNSQSAPRTVFDANYYYAQAVRRRPEWLIDPTLHEYVPLEEAARYIAKMTGVAASDIKSDNMHFRIPVDALDPGDPVWLVGGFNTHPIMGDHYQSELRVGGAPASIAPAEISTMTWGLFNDPQASLLGGWSYHDRRLSFIQRNTTTEMRRQERLDSWDGRGVGDLWGFTCTLIDPLNALARVGLTRRAEPELPAELESKAAHVIAAITDQARAAVELGLRQLGSDQGSSDADLLWLERTKVLAVAVWFNPLKPMVASLEVCTLPDDKDVLVCLRRHPFHPQYRVVGEIGPDGRITDEAISEFLPNPLPNALALWGQPDATADDVPASLRQRVIEIAADSRQDLAAEAGLVASTMGDPWSMTASGSVFADQVRTAGREAAAAQPSSDSFEIWWSVVSRYENVMANFTCLPDAWDAAINSQSAYGGLESFDIGPLVITYATAGLEAGGR